MLGGKPLKRAGVPFSVADHAARFGVDFAASRFSARPCPFANALIVASRSRVDLIEHGPPETHAEELVEGFAVPGTRRGHGRLSVGFGADYGNRDHRIVDCWAVAATECGQSAIVH